MENKQSLDEVYTQYFSTDKCICQPENLWAHLQRTVARGKAAGNHLKLIVSLNDPKKPKLTSRYSLKTRAFALIYPWANGTGDRVTFWWHRHFFSLDIEVLRYILQVYDIHESAGKLETIKDVMRNTEGLAVLLCVYHHEVKKEPITRSKLIEVLQLKDTSVIDKLVKNHFIRPLED